MTGRGLRLLLAAGACLAAAAAVPGRVAQGENHNRPHFVSLTSREQGVDAAPPSKPADASGGGMPAIVLIGAQWGDEGKGKVTDLLGERVQYVVRYQGGNNAGHTVVLPDGRKFALHLLPSGVLTPGCVPVIGS